MRAHRPESPSVTAGSAASGAPVGRGDLLDAAGAERYAAAVTAMRDEVVTRLLTVERPFTGAAAAGLRERIGRVDLDRPLAGRDAVLEELGELWLDDAVWFHHPRYAAHLNCPVAVPAVAADVLASAVNTSQDTWDQSAGATLIEQRLVAWTAARLGFGATADGVFTSGGSQSNLQALLLARESADVRDIGRLRVLVSADGHFSVAKAARVLGLGADAVVPVAVDGERQLRPDELARRLEELVTYGLTPMAVVATAGTTDFGAIDPLPEISALARAHGAWLHVDAAYGGGLVTSHRHRHLLAGIESADSVTVDFHKTFFQPVASSAVIVRDRATLRHVAWHADYLNPERDDPERPNQVDRSLQTTRRFDALKLWFTLRELGADRIGELLDTVIELTRSGHELLAAAPDVEIAARPSLSTLVFRFVAPGVPDARLDAANRSARARLFASGGGAVAATTVDGRAFLKLTLLNPATTVEHVAGLVGDLRALARQELAR
ncbi:pyridoxal phosphate-dependent decarboxylase family protein [Jatrophihabitans fulvus]